MILVWFCSFSFGGLPLPPLSFLLLKLPESHLVVIFDLV